MNVEDHKLTQRVISEVSQIIDMLSQRSKNFIPSDLLNFFKNNAKEIEKYPVDRTIPIDKQDLDKVTYECVSMLMQFIKPIAEYIELEPRWNTIEDKKEAAQRYELEIATNLFNINNILTDRELEKVEYVYDFEYYGRCFNEENYNKLKPFIALCRVLNAMHKKYENTDNYTEIIKMCKFLEEEIRYNLDRTY